MPELEAPRAARQVRLVSKGGVGVGTKVLFGDAGTPVAGVASCAVPRFGPNDFVAVHVELHALEVDVVGEPVFEMKHPLTGEVKAIAKIVFEDGDEFSAA